MKLSVKEAYLAMYHFLDNLYQQARSEELGGLLGSMSILGDGYPADQALWQDWLKAVEKVRNRTE